MALFTSFNTIELNEVLDKTRYCTMDDASVATYLHVGSMRQLPSPL